MAEEIKDLIEKINQEGFQAAEKKAQEIEGEAKHRAQEIVAHAESQAKALMDSASTDLEKGPGPTHGTLDDVASGDEVAIFRRAVNVVQHVIELEPMPARIREANRPSNG